MREMGKTKRESAKNRGRGKEGVPELIRQGREAGRV